MDAAALTRRLEQRARAEGFDAVAVAPAGHLERDGAALAAWLRRDMQAAMAWMARDSVKRADPTLVLPGCRSVVSLAMNYYPGPEHVEPPAGRARVALYARGRDYHKILGRKSKALAAWLAEETGETARAFVDTGPVLERAWAERSGLGWIGKNANLIRRDLGSWLLLAEILTAARLAPHPGPHEDSCGTCTACLEACPTDAIVEPGIVDSNLCISYWTIEHRGSVPRERRVGMGEWMFGCDVCQNVCPWNISFARPVAPERFALREDLDGLDPEEMLTLDEAGFRARYSGTSLMRAKWEGMRRNACIVLGNRREQRALPALARALAHDADPVVRGHAAWALGRIGGEVASARLRSARGHEPDVVVRAEIDSALRGETESRS